MTTSQSATATLPRACQQFSLWGLATLRGSPPSPSADAVRFDLAPSGIPYAHIGGRRVEVAESDPGLFQWIVSELQTRGQVLHAQPRGDDVSNELVGAAIVSAYEFDEGEIELTSCLIEPRPILRLTFLRDGATDAPLRHVYVWSDSEELDEGLAQSLRLDDVVPLDGPPAALEAQRVRRWVDASLVRERRNLEADELGEFVVAALLWCGHASGKIEFTAGRSAVEIAFSGWARLLAAGDELPPPYRCPLSGKVSRRLGVSSDGRIVPREALGVCDQSQRRVLLSEMDRCRESGQRVQRELLAPCMASGKLVLKSLLQFCGRCNQPVAPSAIHSGRCGACRRLAPVRSDDPRMCRVLDEYPKLDRWRRWQLSETDTTYVLTTKSLVRQILLVVHKETLSILYAAVAGRIWSPWQEMTQLQRDDLVG